MNHQLIVNTENNNKLLFSQHTERIISLLGCRDVRPLNAPPSEDPTRYVVNFAPLPLLERWLFSATKRSPEDTSSFNSRKTDKVGSTSVNWKCMLTTNDISESVHYSPRIRTRQFFQAYFTT